MSTQQVEAIDTPNGTFTGKGFEKRLLLAAERLEKKKILTMSRYGVQSSGFGGEVRAIQSLPDFEGVTYMGMQFICEAKTIDTDVLPLHTKFLKKRQVTFMAERADFNVPCFIMVLHRGRELKTKSVASTTMVYPVHRNFEWVQRCLAAYKAKEDPQGSIPREMGFEVDWLLPKTARQPAPDLETAVSRTREIIFTLN